MSNLSETLKERGSRYGDFRKQFSVAQDIKTAMEGSDNYEHLVPFMRESLDMIAHKISRILSGDPMDKDSWHDIAGYATLIDKYLESKARPADGASK